MELGSRVASNILHCWRRRHMSAQEVGFPSMHIEVSVGELEFSANIANDCVKIGCADRQFAAFQDAIQIQRAYEWHVVLLLIAHGTRQRHFTSWDGSVPESRPRVLRVKRNLVRPAGQRLSVVLYLAL